MLVDQRVRLCLRDLYAQDIVEMIERETRRYELHSIEHPSHPDFERAYRILWDAFGPQPKSVPVVGSQWVALLRRTTTHRLR